VRSNWTFTETADTDAAFRLDGETLLFNIGGEPFQMEYYAFFNGKVGWSFNEERRFAKKRQCLSKNQRSTQKCDTNNLFFSIYEATFGSNTEVAKILEEGFSDARGAIDDAYRAGGPAGMRARKTWNSWDPVGSAQKGKGLNDVMAQKGKGLNDVIRKGFKRCNGSKRKGFKRCNGDVV
jgi:hypothetical protein